MEERSHNSAHVERQH